MTHIGRRDTLHAISGWLYELANLTAGSAPLNDAKAKVASIATALADDFPADAFSRQSLIAVARECKFFPSYAELVAVLSPWWREHRPTPTAIAGPAAYEHIPTPRRMPTKEEIEDISASAARAIADIKAMGTEATRAIENRPQARYLPREMLNRHYAQAGIAGPKVQP